MGDQEMLILKYGGRWDFWLSHVSIVERYVQAHVQDLTQVHVLPQGAVAQGAEPAMRATTRAIMWDPTRGGMRMPHLHYRGEILVLDERQWADFSKTAVTALAKKLTEAQKVPFETVMRVSEAIGEV